MILSKGELSWNHIFLFRCLTAWRSKQDRKEIELVNSSHCCDWHADILLLICDSRSQALESPQCLDISTSLLCFFSGLKFPHKLYAETPGAGIWTQDIFAINQQCCQLHHCAACDHNNTLKNMDLWHCSIVTSPVQVFDNTKHCVSWLKSISFLSTH